MCRNNKTVMSILSVTNIYFCITSALNVSLCCTFFPGLARDLQTKLHGQHLAQSVVLKAIQGFVKNPESNKPLTLSFHGWSGTGKNFVARIIADNLYRDGVKSECVRLFIAPFHFPHARLVDTYKVRGRRSCTLGTDHKQPCQRHAVSGLSDHCSLCQGFLCLSSV